jgi:ankyrin repeat protein
MDYFTGLAGQLTRTAQVTPTSVDTGANSDTANTALGQTVPTMTQYALAPLPQYGLAPLTITSNADDSALPTFEVKKISTGVRLETTDNAVAQRICGLLKSKLPKAKDGKYSKTRSAHELRLKGEEALAQRESIVRKIKRLMNNASAIGLSRQQFIVSDERTSELLWALTYGGFRFEKTEQGLKAEITLIKKASTNDTEHYARCYQALVANNLFLPAYALLRALQEHGDGNCGTCFCDMSHWNLQLDPDRSKRVANITELLITSYLQPGSFDPVAALELLLIAMSSTSYLVLQPTDRCKDLVTLAISNYKLTHSLPPLHKRATSAQAKQFLAEIEPGVGPLPVAPSLPPQVVNAPSKQQLGQQLLEKIWSRDLDAAMALIDSGADLTVRNAQGKTALHLAAERSQQGKDRLVAKLLAKGADINTRDNAGRTPLFVAAEESDMGVATLLIQKGASVNVPRDDGRTPLMLAAQTDNLPMIRLLVDKGAALDDEDSRGLTALSHAKSEPARKLLRTPSKLLKACAKGGVDQIYQLLKDGANLNETDPFTGDTPLHLLCARADVPPYMVEMFLEEGADPNATNNESLTPLMVAVDAQDTSKTRLLIHHKALVDIQTSNGNTALHRAAMKVDRMMMQLLIGWGANRNLPNYQGKTADTLLAEALSQTPNPLPAPPAQVKLDQWALDEALFAYCRTGRIEDMKIVLAQGADANARRNGETPLTLARRRRDEEMVNLLLKHGATKDT